VEGFTVQSRVVKKSPPVFLWVDDEQGFTTPRTPRPSPPMEETVVETRAKQCIDASSSCDVQYMSALIKELEQIQYDCTEEGNQTNDECDVVLKDERETLIHALEDKILAVTAASTMVMFMSTAATATSELKAEDRAKACLDGRLSMSVQEMETLLNKLDLINSDCTEEGNQTNDECDITLKAERDVLIKKLERKINASKPNMMTQIQACLNADSKCSLGDLTHMLDTLEKQNDMCTEEGNQTNEECDVMIKAEREELMALLEKEILAKQGSTAQNTRDCLKYKLCDTSALNKTLQDLEALNNLCTEEGNQTRSLCSLDAKEERDRLMEQVRYALELSSNVDSLQYL